MTAWCDSRCRRWCRTLSMLEILAIILQILLVVCSKRHQWVYIGPTTVSLMYPSSSKDADIAYFERVIWEVAEHRCLLKTRQLFETGCGRYAAQILCQFLHVWIPGVPKQLYLLMT